MNYEEGKKYIISLYQKLKNGKTKLSLIFGTLSIEIPGHKGFGDYRVMQKGTAPTHVSIVKAINRFVTSDNFNDVIDALEDIYLNGLKAKTNTFKQDAKELIFWITLQEEINYPQPVNSGRRLPFQRFYEAALSKLNICNLEEVIKRTNNHGKARPILYNIVDIKKPDFYK